MDKDGSYIGPKRFKGGFILYRKKPRKLSGYIGGKRIGTFVHRTLEGAEAEAARLVEQFPDTTFVIMREVATVKARTVPEVQP